MEHIKCCPKDACQSEFLTECRDEETLPDGTVDVDIYFRCDRCGFHFNEEDAGPSRAQILLREHRAAIAAAGPRDESEYFSDNAVGF